MIRTIYNLLYPPFAAFSAPFWLLKTRKRGGLGPRLGEKLAQYGPESPRPTPERASRPIYLHAASVGEANIARKLIVAWAEHSPEARFLLAVGTSTGFDLVRQSPPPGTEVLYAPLDVPSLIRRMLDRFQPGLIVLIEHEVWPNLMHEASRRRIPVALVNARLSERSGARLAKARPLVESMYRGLTWVGAQSEDDRPRLAAIGIREEVIHVTGSIKFDPARSTPASTNFDPRPLLTSLGPDESPILMALSTHGGEELLFARAAATVGEARLVIIPRHMERRDEICRELRAAGFAVRLRSADAGANTPTPTTDGQTLILVVDSTGEMPAFTRHATIAFVGKTLTATGGQNPCEAIAEKIPVLAGPHLENFEPLASELRARGGLLSVTNEEELARGLRSLLSDPRAARQQAAEALAVLESHRGATDRTIAALAKLAHPD
ncbi:3-deoxy-D-manno-octulosonic acid transferase [Roseibacillus ishigakijimensis]|uniref:3-deoxy-D-manno-octulosonic acid transferase n=1 Tax=Roseibacillus ishigakijimensis TaxID=454146 RepID=A0A934RK29_9BACT|nr:glycosyltransferase N-terminal domain-containing protein [Roseibacillus ishigakijimensis]MBK1833152.1 hypothetical protein [Roseibacillus ishigakijimensis]